MCRPLLLSAPLITTALHAQAVGLSERHARLKLIGTTRALHLAGEKKRGDYRCKRYAVDQRRARSMNGT